VIELARAVLKGTEALNEDKPRTFSFPTALTVLTLVLVVVWVAAFFIPAGVYDLDPDGGPIPGTYHELPSCDDVVADGVRGAPVVLVGPAARSGRSRDPGLAARDIRPRQSRTGCGRMFPMFALTPA